MKAKKVEQLTKEVVPFYFEKFEAIAKKNNGHLALGKVSNFINILTNLLYVEFNSTNNVFLFAVDLGRFRAGWSIRSMELYGPH